MQSETEIIDYSTTQKIQLQARARKKIQIKFFEKHNNNQARKQALLLLLLL